METNIENRENKNVTIKTIKPINIDTVHKICSGQVVLSLAVAVKELVENALDAKATNIDIRFKNYGIDLIEISDNGNGVTEDNFAALTLKHHTSKLSDYSDLLEVESFGFRGEALSSLCALANLTITTRHKNYTHATKIEYDHKGNITKKTPCSRQVGTTVNLSNLFYSLPVRQKEFHKNAKREFNKMTQLLYAYCLISLGVKITCSNQTSSKSVVVATQGSNSYKDNIACVFGLKQLQSLLQLKPEYESNVKDNILKGLSQEVKESQETIEIDDVEINLSEDSNDAETNKTESASSSQSDKSQGYKNIITPIEFTGYISSCAHGSGRSSTDRQFYYVNSRPCEPTKVMKLINEVYRQYNPNQYPFVFISINLERTSVDVNVTPDKRKIFLTKEKFVLDVLKQSLLKLFDNIPRTVKVETSIYDKDKTTATKDDIKPEISQPRIFNSFLQQYGSKFSSKSNSIEKNDNKSHELKRKSTTLLDFISSKIKKAQTDGIASDDNIIFQQKEFDKLNNSIFNEEKSTEILDGKLESSIIPGSVVKVAECCIKMENASDKDDDILNKSEKNSIMYLEFSDEIPNTQIRKLNEVIIEKTHTISCKPKSNTSKENITLGSHERPVKKIKTVTDKDDLGKYNSKTVCLKTSIEHVRCCTEIYHKQKSKSAPEKVKFKSKIEPVFNKKCEEELSKEISKESFKDMSVIGQFNLGFIITKLEDDLFIIDQHATDEIYNFETLQKTTELTSQKLVIPQQLELTGVNEQILMENLEIFKKNGFTFEINPEALPTKRVKLLTLPMSKNWVFGKEDIEELLFMLREAPSEHCRPSRVRAMFASRACRKSVMIGTALSKADMKKLVDHMAEIDKPWNCPHGRPTIRHLVNLAMVHTRENCESS